MQFDRRRLLQAIDACEGLRRHLEQRKPDAMKALASFRKRMGDGCTYVTATLQVLWKEEIENGSGDVQPHLRAAGLAA